MVLEIGIQDEHVITLENIKAYLETHYFHKLGDVFINETLTTIKVHELQIASWTLIKDQQLMKLFIGTENTPQYVKVNAHLDENKMHVLKQLLT